MSHGPARLRAVAIGALAAATAALWLIGGSILIWTLFGSDPAAARSWLLVRDAVLVAALAAVIAVVVRRLMKRMDRSRTRLIQGQRSGRQIGDALPDGLLLHREGRIVYANPAAAALLGYPDGVALRGTFVLALTHDDDTPVVAKALEAADAGDPTPVRAEVAFLGMNGNRVPVEIASAAISWQDDHAGVLVLLDLQEIIAARGAMERSRRFEVMSHLAAGAAHDFKNMLTIISGYADLMRVRARQAAKAGGTGDDQQRAVESLADGAEKIATASDRATRLARKLLALSRGEGDTVIVNVNDLVNDVGRMLPGVLGPKIELRVEAAANDPTVRADPVQVDQVLTNLVLNARDALNPEQGGRITITTDDVATTSGRTHGGNSLAPGRYVRIAVKDTGCGMDDAVITRIYEPFFTTKPDGTGLGLPTVRHIVHDYGGAMDVASKPGRGSTFCVYLPVADGDAAEAPSGLRSTLVPDAAQFAGRLLVVEEEGPMRVMMCSVLASLGYEVHDVRHPGEALLVAERLREPIHLMLVAPDTPYISSEDLAQRIRQHHPDMMVLLVSDPDSGVVAKSTSKTRCISKPFTADTLSRSVAETLAVRGLTATVTPRRTTRL